MYEKGIELNIEVEKILNPEVTYSDGESQDERNFVEDLKTMSKSFKIFGSKTELERAQEEADKVKLEDF